MVKHIVLFKLKDGISQSKKNEVMQNFKEAIEVLPAVIPFIKSIEVGLNSNPEEQWDIVLYSEFDSLADVKKYAIHPEHIKAGKILSEFKEDRACVDYTL